MQVPHAQGMGRICKEKICPLPVIKVSILCGLLEDGSDVAEIFCQKADVCHSLKNHHCSGTASQANSKATARSANTTAGNIGVEQTGTGDYPVTFSWLQQATVPLEMKRFRAPLCLQFPPSPALQTSLNATAARTETNRQRRLPAHAVACCGVGGSAAASPQRQ